MSDLKNNLEQLWKEEARKAYQDQQSQDNEGGCREPIGFVQGYLVAKKSDFEEIKTLKEQLANGLKILKAQKTILETRFNYHYCASDIFLEKQDKENKDEK